MSDLTNDVLDELERLEKAYRESWGAVRKDRYLLRGELSGEMLTHARDLIEAARERDRLRAALSEARQFIANGIEFGYIAKPQPGTREAKCLPMIEAALERKDGD